VKVNRRFRGRCSLHHKNWTLYKGKHFSLFCSQQPTTGPIPTQMNPVYTHYPSDITLILTLISIKACVLIKYRPVAKQRPRNNNYAAAVTRQRPVNSNWGIVFSTRSLPRYYKHGHIAVEISEWLRELLRFMNDTSRIYEVCNPIFDVLIKTHINNPSNYHLQNTNTPATHTNKSHLLTYLLTELSPSW
jgi:hypothetical protein